MNKNTPLLSAKDLSLVEDNSLNEKQLKHLLKTTPKKYIRKRPAKGGGHWEYVTGGYVKKCLNLMFGWDWDFEIIDEKILIEAKEVIVKGKLTCRSNGKTIVKMQYGNKDIIFQKGTTIPLSIGNDMKSAATDALKKCASEIGIASDIYNKEEFKEINIENNIDDLDWLKNILNDKLKYINHLNENDIKSIKDAEKIINNKDYNQYKNSIKCLLNIKTP